MGAVPARKTAGGAARPTSEGRRRDPRLFPSACAWGRGGDGRRRTALAGRVAARPVLSLGPACCESSNRKTPRNFRLPFSPYTRLPRGSTNGQGFGERQGLGMGAQQNPAQLRGQGRWRTCKLRLACTADPPKRNVCSCFLVVPGALPRVHPRRLREGKNIDKRGMRGKLLGAVCEPPTRAHGPRQEPAGRSGSACRGHADLRAER